MCIRLKYSISVVRRTEAISLQLCFSMPFRKQLYRAFQNEILHVSNHYTTLMAVLPQMTDLVKVTKENLREI